MILQIDHINIVVNDLDESIDFYTNILGFHLSRRMTLQGDWIETIVGINNIAIIH
jgi:catechol 2,3-dioxygenase-like lactoylglutathione lyase family enzyme